jgi:Ca-activated chloride channel homolog
MSLASPLWLLLLIPVAALVASYVVQLGRRSRYAVTFATLPMLERLTPEKPGWRRHLPAVFLVLAFVTLCVAAARPQVDVEVPRERATVVVVADVSLSMEAIDVDPDRITAASRAAQSFVEGLPDGFNVGVVSFAGVATVLAPPTTDHQASIAALGQLELDEGTAIGDGVITSLAQIASSAAAEGLDDGGPGADGLPEDGGTDGTEDGEEEVPAQIVLLSDGTNTVGSSIDQAATAAIDAGVPVSTIAYGTPDGTVVVDGQLIPVPVDQESLDALAVATGGTGYAAETAEALDEVYDDIQSSIGFTTEQRDVTPYVVAIALLLGLLAAAMSLRWFARLP